jgi:hypothetical protein
MMLYIVFLPEHLENVHQMVKQDNRDAFERMTPDAVSKL